MSIVLYPLKFEPILKERIWGGEKLKDVLNKKSQNPNIGESWEISDVEGDESIVAEGALQGNSLSSLINHYKGDLLGNRNYAKFGNKFPILIKYIDAKTALSVQLHPNDELAKKRHNSFGKTEMWYIMDADDNSELILGLKKDVDADSYVAHLEKGKITDVLHSEKVKKGDTFFIEVGRVHAIGAGVLLAEIQQTSDITYRIYDWDRVDKNGNARELHTELALDAIDFNMPEDCKATYDTRKNTSNEMVSCQYFKTRYLPVEGELDIWNDKDSFFIYMCTDGIAEFITETYSTQIQRGETILIPAAVKEYKIKSNAAELLEVYV